MKNVLVVVDMQNDFLQNDGALNLGHDTTDLRKRVAEYVRGFDGLVLLTCDTHEENAAEFKAFPKHCLKGTPGAYLCDEILETVKDSQAPRIPLEKQSYTSDIISTFLANRAEPDTEFHVVGVCTHICVHDVIAGFVNKVKNEKNFVPKVIVHRSMVDDFNPEMAEFALKRLQNLYGVVVE